MVKKNGGYKVRMAILLLVALMLVLAIDAATAHNHGGYLYFDDDINVANEDWMGDLPDELPLSAISIPGTHDTMADDMSDACTIKWLEMVAQSMGLRKQLDSGIRVLDIRAHHIEDVFTMHHGSCYLNARFGADVMQVAIDFLEEYPSETILMRIQEESDAENVTRTFAKTYEWYRDIYGASIWDGYEANPNPTLGEVRGKIVILDNFAGGTYGLDFQQFRTQDDYNMITVWDLCEDKWPAVKSHLAYAADGDKNVFYVNFLSATGGIGIDGTDLDFGFPYFYASGHALPLTDASRITTGTVDPVTSIGDDWWPDFPRLDCFLGSCQIFFEGTNVLTTNLLNDNDWTGGKNQRVGIIMADFPGGGLINSVIEMNPWNIPPVADVGGPYSAAEATAITFDASASSDADGDTLTFRWIFDNDEFIDSTPWSNNPTYSKTWHDDWSGTVTVKVSDGNFVSEASTSLTVSNVAPTVTATGDIINENGVAAVSGTISDPSYLDSFEVVIDWGEGDPQSYDYSSGSTTFSEDHQYKDDNPGGTMSDDYNISVTVTDDDGGAGSAAAAVTVNNLNPTTLIDQVTDETAQEVGTGVRVVLVHTRLDLQASFTDVGTDDTHTAVIDWDDGVIVDLSDTTGSIFTTHTYLEPDGYTVLLEVTDDDTGVGPVSTSITVVDATGAVELLINQLEALVAGPGLYPDAVKDLNDALDQLRSGDGGSAANGALDELAKGNLNAALVKMWQAMRSLEAAEAADAALNLKLVKSLLALTAKSAAMTAIVEADEIAIKPNELRKVENAFALAGAADGQLAALNYADAIDGYREAAQEVQGFVS